MITSTTRERNTQEEMAAGSNGGVLMSGVLAVCWRHAGGVLTAC